MVVVSGKKLKELRKKKGISVEEIAKLDVVSMTPIDALNKLFELNEKAKRI